MPNLTASTTIQHTDFVFISFNFFQWFTKDISLSCLQQNIHNNDNKQCKSSVLTFRPTYVYKTCKMFLSILYVCVLLYFFAPVHFLAVFFFLH